MLLNTTCASQYQLYLNDEYMNSLNVLNDESCASCAIAPIAQCLYNEVGALNNANMQAAGVVLGLLPTILTFVGTSKIETGLVAFRRPLLSILISAGAPAVSPLRSFDYTDLRRVLYSWDDRKPQNVPTTSWGRCTIVLLEYLFVLAAIANNVHVTWHSVSGV